MERAAGLAHDDDLNAKLDKLDVLWMPEARHERCAGRARSDNARINRIKHPLIKHLKDVRPKLNVVADNAELWCLFD